MFADVLATIYCHFIAFFSCLISFFSDFYSFLFNFVLCVFCISFFFNFFLFFFPFAFQICFLQIQVDSSESLVGKIDEGKDQERRLSEEALNEVTKDVNQQVTFTIDKVKETSEISTPSTVQSTTSQPTTPQPTTSQPTTNATALSHASHKTSHDLQPSTSSLFPSPPALQVFKTKLSRKLYSQEQLNEKNSNNR